MSSIPPAYPGPFFNDPTWRVWYDWFASLDTSVGLVDTLPTGQIFIGDASNVATAQTVSGDGTLSAAGVLTITAVPTTVTVANEATDTTCFPTFVTAATGSLGIKSNANLTFNSSTGVLTSASLVATTADINGGTVDAAVIGGATPAAGTFTALTANGNVVLGDNTADTITIHPSAVTWQNAPTHSNNHTFSGNLTVSGIGTFNGNNVIGNASGDTLTIAPSAVTWSNAPTHSNSHIFSGSVSARGGVAPAVTEVHVQIWDAGVPLISLVDSARTANNRLVSEYFSAGTFSIGFTNDAFAATLDGLQITGGHGAGVSLFAVPLATSSVFGHTASVTVANAGKVQVVGTTAATSQIQASCHAAAATGPNIALGKSRHATAGSNTIVQDGDTLGSITAYGADGTNYDTAAQIIFEVDGTPGAGTDMPGRIRFLTSPNATATLTEALKIDNAQVCTFAANPAGRIIGSTYSPTRSAEANLDANVTMSQAQYMRVGATVTVSGAFTADPTAPGATSFEFDLPVASNIGAVEDLAGVAFAGGIAGQGAAISGSVANNTAVVSWIAVDVTSQAWSYTLTYQVI